MSKQEDVMLFSSVLGVGLSFGIINSLLGPDIMSVFAFTLIVGLILLIYVRLK